MTTTGLGANDLEIERPSLDKPEQKPFARTSWAPETSQHRPSAASPGAHSFHSITGPAPVAMPSETPKLGAVSRTALNEE